MSSAALVAEQLAWSVSAPGAQNEDFNTVNGDVFRWKWMWKQIADYFGIEAQAFPQQVMPLEPRMSDADRQWKALAEQHQLREPDINRLASWWHTDADLGRPMEVFTDMSKSRKAGFSGYHCTRDDLFALFDRLKQEKLIPA